MTETLTFYTAKGCPFAQRVDIALREASANYKSYEIDLQNKPEWYAPQVNAASKVPAVAYGGPDVSPDRPSAESQKIAESLVLLEFVADLYPDSSLLPKDPVLRARTRFFIDTVSNKFFPGFAAIIRGDSADATIQGVEAIQALLPSEGFAIGPEYTIADAAVAPFAGRINLFLKHEIGPFKEGGRAKQLYETLQTDPKYERFRKYYSDLTDRPSYKSTFDEDYLVARMKARFAAA